ncbi:hypothetical protein [Pseudanabaena sp. 'Roaring Creek']|uniref:hypothetical protein n=1 Tax=Pseudanabaena sp. 'Roaring Creek' TaxID=1681830 RepID=UPI0006D80B9B|nr:hypothetical protein [Pseudanabaena sp. 'Roaring Creek']
MSPQQPTTKVEPRNLFYTKVFIFLSISFLSGSLAMLDDIYKNGLTFLKGGTVGISLLSAIGVTVDKMEKETNTSTPEWFAFGRNPDKALVNANAINEANQALPPSMRLQTPGSLAEELVNDIPMVKQLSKDLTNPIALAEDAISDIPEVDKLIAKARKNPFGKAKQVAQTVGNATGAGVSGVFGVLGIVAKATLQGLTGNLPASGQTVVITPSNSQQQLASANIPQIVDSAEQISKKINTSPVAVIGAVVQDIDPGDKTIATAIAVAGDVSNIASAPIKGIGDLVEDISPDPNVETVVNDVEKAASIATSPIGAGIGIISSLFH